MIFTRTFLNSIATNLCTSSILSGVLSGNLFCRLVKFPFSPAYDLALPPFPQEANFDGYNAILSNAGDRAVEQMDGNRLGIRVSTGATGGYRWRVTTTFALPQTIFGAVICQSNSAHLDTTNLNVASFLLDKPVVLTAAFQQLIIPDVSFVMELNGFH